MTVPLSLVEQQERSDNMYVDYEYYKNEYLGDKLTEKEFKKYSREASAYIDYLSSKAVKPIIDSKNGWRVKDAICKLSEMYKQHDLDMNKLELISSQSIGLSSESVKSHSISFNNGTQEKEKHLKAFNDLKYQTVFKYLLPLGMLYRGL